MSISGNTPRRAERGGTFVRSWCCGLFVWLLASAPALAQTGPLIILTSVQVSGEGNSAVVVIEADGPLPVPVAGRVESPARFFLDLPGIITGTHGSRGKGHPPIDRVRVGLHSSNPPVTRVVLDLAQHRPVQIDTDARQAGRIRLIVGVDAVGTDAPTVEPEPRAEPQSPLNAMPPASVASADPPANRPVTEPTGRPQQALLPPVMPMPPGAAETPPPTPTPRPREEPPAPRPEPRKEPPPHGPEPRKEPPPPAVYPVKSGASPAKPSTGDVSRYRVEVEQPLNRLRVLRALLTQIDQQELKAPDGLPEARAELSAIIRVLAGVHPPDSLKPTHDLLVRSASLGMMSATLRANAGVRTDPTAIRNASSAAAGALLLLDRVCIEIGCTESPEVK